MSVRTSTIKTMIDQLNQSIDEFERDVNSLTDRYDPETATRRQIDEISKSQEQLDAYIEMKAALEALRDL